MVTALVQVLMLSPSHADVSNTLMKSSKDGFLLEAGRFPLWFDQSWLPSGKDLIARVAENS